MIDSKKSKRGRKKGPATITTTVRFPVDLYKKISNLVEKEGKVLNSELVKLVKAGFSVLYPSKPKPKS